MRHNLSLNKCFEKVENKMSGSSRKGCLWALNLARIDKMEEEMQKWKRTPGLFLCQTPFSLLFHPDDHILRKLH